MEVSPENASLRCRIYCTVVSGFEASARDEAKDKFGDDMTDAYTERGCLKFNIPVARVDETAHLRAIDNLYVVLLETTKLFSKDKAEAAKEVNDLISIHQDRIQWRTGFIVWKTVAGSLRREKGLHFDIPSQFDSTSNYLPSFRATCYRSGKHVFTSQEAMVDFGSSLNDMFAWKVDLKNYDVEVVLIVDDDRVSICLTLTLEPLFKRNIAHFGSTTLRPTIAYNMIRLGNPQPGEIMCDPMCGSGSIPIEAALAYPNIQILCGDNHPVAWERTAANVDAIGKKASRKQLNNVQVVGMDIDQFPLRPASVDLWVSDFPFGKRHKCDRNDLYPKALAAMARASKEGLTRAVIVTQDKKAMTMAVRDDHRWFIQRMIGINLGGLNACVYLLLRTRMH